MPKKRDSEASEVPRRPTLTVRDLIKALADFEMDAELHIALGATHPQHPQIMFGPRVPITSVSSVHTVLCGNPRVAKNLVVLAGSKSLA